MCHLFDFFGRECCLRSRTCAQDQRGGVQISKYSVSLVTGRSLARNSQLGTLSVSRAASAPTLSSTSGTKPPKHPSCCNMAHQAGVTCGALTLSNVAPIAGNTPRRIGQYFAAWTALSAAKRNWVIGTGSPPQRLTRLAKL